EAAQLAEASRRVGAELAQPFDLATGPLFRAGLLRLGARDHVLLLGVHHLLARGRSGVRLPCRLAPLYRPPPPPPRARAPPPPPPVPRLRRLAARAARAPLRRPRPHVLDEPSGREPPAPRPPRRSPAPRRPHLSRLADSGSRPCRRRRPPSCGRTPRA